MNGPSNKNKEVLVLDGDGKYLLPTTPALARKLLNEGKARVVSKDPFSISLFKNVESPNTSRRYETMKAINLHEYFNVSKAVYIQNISDPIGVISLTFKKLNGEIIPCPILSSRNPIILTDKVAFEDIKESIEFRTYLRANSYGPAKLQLLTEEEFNGYYDRRAKEIGASTSELIEETHRKAESIAAREKIVTEKEAFVDPRTMDHSILEPEVNTRVISTCQQLDPSNPSKISARDAIDTFNSLNMTQVDYDYILSNCFDRLEKNNAVIRKWAMGRLKDINGPSMAHSEIIMPQQETEQLQKDLNPPVQRTQTKEKKAAPQQKELNQARVKVGAGASK
jgi:hypothetical protein